MSKSPFVCVHHFHNVVTTSAGGPACRACGKKPTAEEEETLQTLIDWQKARLRANVSRRKGSGN